MSTDLDLAREVDLQLDYDGFQKLALNPHLTPNERIGFPNSYRENFDGAIFSDIMFKLPALNGIQKTIVDIGPGCANLPRRLIDLCEMKGHRLALVDSPAMLSQLPDGKSIVKVEGACRSGSI